MNFRNVLAIFKKELSLYFNTPMAYIILIIFLVISGYFFSYGQTGLFVFGQADMRITFQILHSIFVIFIPAISMRLIAEEKTSGTLHLLITMPISEFEIILGKFLAALVLILTYLFFTLRYPWILSQYGSLDLGPVFGGYLGLIFVGAAYTSIGIFASAISKNQLVAFILGVVMCFAVQMTNQVPHVFASGEFFGELDASSLFFDAVVFLSAAIFVTAFVKAVLPNVGFKKIVGSIFVIVFAISLLFAAAKYMPSVFIFLGLDYHFENIARGVIDSRDILYNLSIVAFFLFAATKTLETRKWR